MALNAYSLSRCVNAERKTKKELIISRWGFFPLCLLFFLGCLSLGVIRQEREEWTSFIKLKYALCSLFSLLQDCPPTMLRKKKTQNECGLRKTHQLKKEQDKWLWQEGQEGKLLSSHLVQKVWLECPRSGLGFPCCDSGMKGIDHLS